MTEEANKPVMLKVLSHTVSLATRAGAEIRKILLSGKLGVVDKSQGLLDYQTEADRLAQRMIVANLSRKFPASFIVGEEQLEEDKQADEKLLIDDYDQEILKLNLPNDYNDIQENDLTIWIDPLDGTTEFVKGLLEHVTVLIGISYKGRSVAGVIHQPFHGYGIDSVSTHGEEMLARVSELKGRTMWGLVGLGCFGVEPKSLPEDKFIITTTASHSNANVEESIASLKPDQVLKVGGAGHKVLLVLEGKAHAFVFTSNGCKRWDTSAPEALLRAAGGRLTDAFGKQIEYQYNDSRGYQNFLGVVAAINQRFHSRVIDGIPETVKERLLKYRDSTK